MCKDEHTITICEDGKFIEQPCKGAAGCRYDDKLVKCDESHGDYGDRCSHDGNYTCAVDGSAQLTCVNGKWKLASTCRGPKKCWPDGENIMCDQTFAKEDDPCEGSAAACSAAPGAVLHCEGGRYTIRTPCPWGCEIKDKLVQCKPKGI